MCDCPYCLHISGGHCKADQKCCQNHSIITPSITSAKRDTGGHIWSENPYGSHTSCSSSAHHWCKQSMQDIMLQVQCKVWLQACKEDVQQHLLLQWKLWQSFEYTPNLLRPTLQLTALSKNFANLAFWRLWERQRSVHQPILTYGSYVWLYRKC
jgi:hypothetical protein